MREMNHDFPKFTSARNKMREAGITARSWNNVLVAAEAVRRGIEISTNRGGARINMRHEGIKHFWRLGTNSLNSPLAIKCVDNKEITSRLLRGYGISAPENVVFGPDDVKRAWAWAEPILPVVIKPNNSFQGIGVFMDLDNWDDFSRAFMQAAQGRGEILVEQFHPGDDHRVLVIDSKVVAATRRIAANVIGDGKSSITELVAIKNENRPRSHKSIVLDETSEQYIARRGLSVHSVPEDGETVFLRGTVNMHTGGDTIDVTDELTTEQIVQCELAAKAIPDLGVAGIDLLVPSSPEHGDSSILEINSNPMISMQHFPAYGTPRNAARAVVNAMFPSTALSIYPPRNAPAK